MSDMNKLFNPADWSTIANLILIVISIIFTALSVYYLKNANGIVKYAVVPIGILGSIMVAAIAIVALAAPSGDPMGWNRLPESIEKIAGNATRFTQAFENFVEYFTQQSPSEAAAGTESSPNFDQDAAAISVGTEKPDGTQEEQEVVVVPTERPTPDLTMGPNQPPSKDINPDTAVGGASTKPESLRFEVGNLVTCVLPSPQNDAGIWIYRLNDRDQWKKTTEHTIRTNNANGFLKIDGLSVDVSRFGTRGEPYRFEKVVNGKVVASIGHYQEGEEVFRLYPNQDNFTSWPCP